MKRLLLIITGIISAAVLLNSASSADAAAIYDLQWTGNNGYSIQGIFSYDETQVNPGYIVTKETPGFNLDFSVFDPSSNLLATYLDNQDTYPDLNFNFDPNTNQVLQSGSFNAPNGFDLGIFPPTRANIDFSFYTSSGADPTSVVTEGTIRLCSGDLECASSSPLGQGGIIDQGGVLTAEPIPESASTLGLLVALGGLGTRSVLKKKQTSSQKAELSSRS